MWQVFTEADTVFLVYCFLSIHLLKVFISVKLEFTE